LSQALGLQQQGRVSQPDDSEGFDSQGLFSQGAAGAAGTAHPGWVSLGEAGSSAA